MVRHPRGSYIVPGTATAVSSSGHTGKQIISLKLSSMCKSASRAVLSRMQLTLLATRRTPRGASRLVQAMTAWSVRTRRAPSRHFRDARVHGHTTTALYVVEYTPPPDPDWCFTHPHPDPHPPISATCVEQHRHSGRGQGVEENMRGKPHDVREYLQLEPHHRRLRRGERPHRSRGQGLGDARQLLRKLSECATVARSTMTRAWERRERRQGGEGTGRREGGGGGRGDVLMSCMAVVV